MLIIDLTLSTISFVLSALLIVCTVVVYRKTQAVEKLLQKQVVFPEQASMSVMPSQQPRPLVFQLHPGALVKGPFITPTLGKPKLIRYYTEDYENALRCCKCGREFEEKEFFWSIDVPDFPDGLLGVCVTCYGKAVA